MAALYPCCQLLLSCQLWDHYMLTVGRGEAFILNMPPDTTGRIPKEYAAETAKFGKALKAFNTPVAKVGRQRVGSIFGLHAWLACLLEHGA